MPDSASSSLDLDHDATQTRATDDAVRAPAQPSAKVAGAPMAKPVPPGSTQPPGAGDSDGYSRPDEALRRSARKGFEEQWTDVRDSVDAPHANDPMGGGHGKKAAIEDGKMTGDGGFGLRVLGESAERAQANAGDWGTIARPVTPSLELLDQNYTAQAEFIKTHQNQEGQTMWPGDDPEWIKSQLKYGNTWAIENMESVERYKYEQSRFVGAHNSWVPLANGSHTAMAELVECSKIMGFDGGSGKDAARFVEGLEMSLDMASDVVNAKVLGDDKKTSYAHRADDKTATSKAQPQLNGEQLTPKLDSITAAYREVQTASDGVYLSLLRDKEAALVATKGEVTEEIGRINEVIEFWAGLAETGQGAYKKAKPIVNGSAVNKVEKKLGDGSGHAKKEYKAAGKAAKQGEKDIQKNPTNDDKLWESQRHLTNFRDSNETWGGASEEVEVEHAAKHGAKDAGDDHEGQHGPGGGHTEAPGEGGGEGGMPEFSAGGLVKAGLTLLNKEKLEELTARLASVNAEKAANEQAIGFVETRRAQGIADAAQKKFAEEMKKLDERSVRNREQDMVALGGDLDKYAAEHQGDLKKLHEGGLVAGEHRELYATMMACVAKVEKFRAVSKVATGAFPFNEMMKTFRGLVAERNGGAKPRESKARDKAQTGHAPPRLPSMTGEEGNVYADMTHQYKDVIDQDVHWGIRLEAVVSRFESLMKTIAGGTKHAVGKEF